MRRRVRLVPEASLLFDPSAPVGGGRGRFFDRLSVTAVFPVPLSSPETTQGKEDSADAIVTAALCSTCLV